MLYLTALYISARDVCIRVLLLGDPLRDTADTSSLALSCPLQCFRHFKIHDVTLSLQGTCYTHSGLL